MLAAEAIDDQGDVVGDVPEVASLDPHRQLDRRLDVVVHHLRRHRRLGDRHDAPQRHRLKLVRPGDRDVQQGIDRLDFLGPVRDADEVLVVADRVDPEVLLVELDAGVHRRHDILHDLGLGQPQVGGLGAVDVDQILGIVQPLDHPGVDDPVNLIDLGLDGRGDGVGLLLVLGRDPDVDRGGFALVHGPADHAAGVEGELGPGEPRIGVDPLAEHVDILLGGVLALGGELDLDDGVHRPGVGGVGGRPVGRHADLGDVELQVRVGLALLDILAGRGLVDDLADDLLDLGDLLLGQLDPGAAGGTDVDLEGAGVDLGEELAAELRADAHQRHGQQHHRPDHRQQAMPEDPGQQRRVAGDPRLDQPLPAGEGQAPALVDGERVAAGVRASVVVDVSRSGAGCPLSRLAAQAGTKVCDRM